jgi:hypothetical protein
MANFLQFSRGDCPEDLGLLSLPDQAARITSGTARMSS